MYCFHGEMSTFECREQMALYCIFLLLVFYHKVYSVEISDSGYEDIPPFSTVINFFLNVSNSISDSDSKVSIISEKCCLDIEPNDTDCEIMTLGKGKDVYLKEHETTRVTFSFRNLYVRYRTGECRFLITTENGVNPQRHKITFNTYPTEGQRSNCTGIDQDQDRGCSPVDCAIKYKGHRNYYNATAGKCEPVAKCSTRGSDGITITAYYDWERNECVQYKWFGDENYFNQVESDTEIPANIDPSQTIYYPDLEPQLLMNNSVKLECNHGAQSGLHCECDEGWMSSGIHHDTPLIFHWCDLKESSPLQSVGPPRKLSKPLEYICIIILAIANTTLCTAWVFLSIKLLCPRCTKKLCIKRRKR